MARTSRKNKTESQPTSNFRVWNTAIYGRVSKFNSGQEDAESLEAQIYYVRQYVEHRSELRLVDVYADNGCTGTNFERPEFERLLVDIQQKKIDCVVVKDLSRFGRNVIDTGYYLEKLFPFLGVRFVAVNENYDSQSNKQRDGMVLPIKDLMNEFYSKDLSRKVRSTFALKRERGDNLHVVPFGYQKDEENPGRLILDEAVCGYVEKIFEWKKNGVKNGAIARKLNDLGVPIPHERRKQLGLVKTQGRVKRSEWISDDVRHILINPVYTGNMVYNRYGYPNGYRKSCVMNPREEWVVVKDAHPAIISEELFEAVYELVEMDRDVYLERKQNSDEMWRQQPNLFQNKVFCMHCKRKLRMQRVKSLGKPRFMKLQCMNSTCTHHAAIAEPLLRILIMDQICLQLKAYIDRKELAEIYQRQSGFLEKRKR